MNTDSVSRTTNNLHSDLYRQRAKILEQLRELAIEGILQEADCDGSLTSAVTEYVTAKTQLQELREMPATLMDYAQACYAIAAAEYSNQKTIKILEDLRKVLRDVIEDVTEEDLQLFQQAITIFRQLTSNINPKLIKQGIHLFGNYLIETKKFRPMLSSRLCWKLSVGLDYRLMLSLVAEQLSRTMQKEAFVSFAKQDYRNAVLRSQETISNLIGADYVAFPSVQAYDPSKPINLRLFIRISNVAEKGSHLAPKEKNTEVLWLLTQLNHIEHDLALSIGSNLT